MAVASREEAAAALRVLLPPDLTPLPPPPSPPPPLPTLTNPFLNAAAAAGDSSNGTNPFKNVVTNLFSKRDYPSIDYGDFVLHPRNTTCYHDLEDPVAVHVNSAELMVRRYARDLEGYPSIKDIVELNFVENKTLEQKFLREKDERVWFGQEAESNEVILFHGTQSSSAHSICSGNFDLSKSKRSLYGTGIYLSPCPNISLDYGDDIVVCRVLLGKKQTPKYDGKDKLMEGYDSLIVKLDPDDSDNTKVIVVVRSEKQILPYLIIRAEIERPSSSSRKAKPANRGPNVPPPKSTGRRSKPASPPNTPSTQYLMGQSLSQDPFHGCCTII